LKLYVFRFTVYTENKSIKEIAMGKGRYLSHAMKSKITPFGRWCPKPNARARCMGVEMRKGKGFMEASGMCKVKGK